MHVVVVGGGIGALTAARFLSNEKKDDLRVTLISPRDYVEYIPSALQCMVDPWHVDKSTAVLEDVVRRCKGRLEFVQDQVIGIDDGKVSLRSNRDIAYDCLLIASGTTYDSPIHAGGKTVDERKAELEEFKVRLDKSEHVMIAGGGITGVELAAEIRQTYKDKEVTLVARSTGLILDCGAKASGYVEKWFRKHRVRVITNAKAMPASDGTVQLWSADSGEDTEKLKVDLFIPCFGGKPNSQFMDERYLDRRGRIVVGTDLRVEGMGGSVFAIGDIASISGGHALFAEKTAEVASRNILNLNQNKPMLKYPISAYKVPYELTATAVSLGKWDGIVIMGPLPISGLLAAGIKHFIEWAFVQFLSVKRLGFIYGIVLGVTLPTVRLLDKLTGNAPST
ncbi:hypothetical protein NDN08_000523 [Rhodosorus marinus]|uniref:FAD/NAD(P)-binding domain-containing protein n=1 Tax=Rhodosorus marinus TaxID=101924 RepID=A0AAV8UNB5_9RHOD|nr:hypothetical protein NDN08_000523 [Rhodosorus marinus]